MRHFACSLLLSLACFCLACRQETRTTLPKKETLVEPVAAVTDTTLLRRAADSLFARGEQFISMARKDSSLHYHTKALSILEGMKSNDLQLVASYARVGALNYNINNFETADVQYEKARALAEKIGAPSSVTLPIFLELAACKIELKDLPT